MPLLQDLIHHLEEGQGLRKLRLGVVILVGVTLMTGYNLRCYQNLSTQEAMDAAQLGRNLADGKGFTTLFVRPFSMHLVARHHQRQGPDPWQIKGAHPDLANPPLYPLLLAGLMKAVPMNYNASTNQQFWSNRGEFYRYQPDFVIALLNQLLFFAVIWMLFRMARKLFDPAVAWLSALLLLGNELFWRFSVSGQATMLLAVIFMGLAWCIVCLEQELREPQKGAARVVVLSLLAGLLVGLGGLTRYAFGWLIGPLIVFLLIFAGNRRLFLAAAALAAFAAVMAPWLWRNYALCGHPFGTAGYALLEGSFLFPENTLQRSLEPEPHRTMLMGLWIKLTVSCRQLFQSELPRLGGTWVSAFFLVGLLVGFRNPAIRRLRYFLLMGLVVFIVAQALGRTQLSEDSPEVNSENLLVLFAPLMIVYGVGLFYLLLDQVTLPISQLRYVIIGFFGLIVCAPLLLALLPPRTSPVAYPPYHVPRIQIVASYVRTNELIMCDVPWAMAWYGRRQSVWLTRNAQEDFLAIHDYQKPIAILYLTPAMMDRRILTQWLGAGDYSWGSFILQILTEERVPSNFPLNKSMRKWFPEQLILADRERWPRSAPPP